MFVAPSFQFYEIPWKRFCENLWRVNATHTAFTNWKDNLIVFCIFCIDAGWNVIYYCKINPEIQFTFIQRFRSNVNFHFGIWYFLWKNYRHFLAAAAAAFIAIFYPFLSQPSLCDAIFMLFSLFSHVTSIQYRDLTQNCKNIMSENKSECEKLKIACKISYHHVE